MFLPQNALTFGYDQARDATITGQILGGDLKIQGPPASQPGLYHGVFYYYLLAPAYLVGKGSPIVAAYWIAFVNTATVLLIFALAYLMTKKVWTALLASFLFAISFEASQYATWLSNPTPAVFTVPLMYLGLWLWSTDSKKKLLGSILCALGLGLSIQSEIFLAYHMVPVAIWTYVARKNISRKQISVFLFTLLISVSTMILNEIKFGFKGIEGLKGLVVSSDTNLAYAKSLGDYLTLYLNQVGRIFAFNSYPGNIGYGGGFVIILILVGLVSWSKDRKKEKLQLVSWQPFLATWLFSHLTVVTVGGVSTPFLMVGIGPAVSILLGIYLSNWWSRYKLVSIAVILILIFGNLSLILRENSRGSTLFAIQKDMLLSKQLDAVDYTYEKAGGESFSINSLTSPLWVNIVWDFLYKWHGQEKYDYLPEWHGRDQIGQLGGLAKTKDSTEKYFLILEPMGGIPVQYLGLTVGEENVHSKLIEEKNWGELIIQYRQRN